MFFVIFFVCTLLVVPCLAQPERRKKVLKLAKVDEIKCPVAYTNRPVKNALPSILIDEENIKNV